MAERTTFYLVRHAEAQSNVIPAFGETNNILTDAGSGQAKALAKRFRHIHVDGIFASPVERAQLTAREVQEVTGIMPKTFECLKERKVTFLDGGAFEYNEPYEEVMKRVREAVELFEKTEERHVVVVSHAIFIRTLAAYILLGDMLTEDALIKMYDVFVTENTGVSKFIFNKEKRKWRMASWNDVEHLTD